MRPVLAALALGLVVGGFAGWHLRTPPPAPAVHAAEASREAASLTQHVEAGPERVTVTEYLPGPVRLIPGPPREVPGPERLVEVPGPERIVRVTVTERGPVVTDTHAATASEHHAELVVVPPPPVARPGWAVGAGLQLLPDQRLELALERRIVGPIWVRAWALQPAAVQPPAVGVGVRVEW